MLSSTPHPVDVHVGAMIRLRRKQAGLTQAQLGEALDMSFQQVQKYERGVNRVAASTLFSTAQFLDVPIDYFFSDLIAGDGVPVEGLGEHTAPTFELFEVSRMVQRIKNARHRQSILQLIEALAEDGRS